MLDEILGGGLTRSRGYMIEGDSFSGKELFAMQIMCSSLERGEACVYISFNKRYLRVREEFYKQQCPLISYIDNGRFGFIDLLSLQHQCENTLRSELSDSENSSVVFLADPMDVNSLFDADVSIRNGVSGFGVTIIDSLSDHLLVAHSRSKPKEAIINYYVRSRQRFGEIEGNIGLHLFNKEIKREIIGEYEEFLNEKEDGTIYLKRVMKDGVMEEQYLFGHIKSQGIVIPRFEYEIINGRIELKPTIDYKRKENGQMEKNQTKSLSPEEREVIIMLAREYDIRDSVKTLWANAGGREEFVPNISKPNDLWTSLWKSAKAGASASPEAIVREALLSYPGNLSLIEYLNKQMDADCRKEAESLVMAFNNLPENLTEDDIVPLLKSLEKRSSEEISNMITPAIHGHIKKGFRDTLINILKSIAKGASEAGKAGIEAAAKGITQALLGSAPKS